MKIYKNVDEYIKNFEEDKKEILNKIRSTVLSVNKNIEESIAYGMPAYKYKGKPLFYFSATKRHIGIYPTPGPIVKNMYSLKDFSISKGCIRIPYGYKISKKLIVSLIKERIKEIN